MIHDKVQWWTCVLCALCVTCRAFVWHVMSVSICHKTLIIVCTRLLYRRFIKLRNAPSKTRSDITLFHYYPWARKLIRTLTQIHRFGVQTIIIKSIQTTIYMHITTTTARIPSPIWAQVSLAGTAHKSCVHLRLLCFAVMFVYTVSCEMEEENEESVLLCIAKPQNVRNCSEYVLFIIQRGL